MARPIRQGGRLPVKTPMLGCSWRPPCSRFSRDSDGTVLLCLYQRGTHEHPSLMSPDEASPGNGLLLFSMSMTSTWRRRDEEPRVNPATGTREFALRDPDGYYVMVSAVA
jgi:hypothetical protein